MRDSQKAEKSTFLSQSINFLEILKMLKQALSTFLTAKIIVKFGQKMSKQRKKVKEIKTLIMIKIILMF